jgi:hypothetical protein
LSAHPGGKNSFSQGRLDVHLGQYVTERRGDEVVFSCFSARAFSFVSSFLEGSLAVGPIGLPALHCRTPKRTQGAVGAQSGRSSQGMQQAVRDALIGFMATTAQAQVEAAKATELS